MRWQVGWVGWFSAAGTWLASSVGHFLCGSCEVCMDLQWVCVVGCEVSGVGYFFLIFLVGWCQSFVLWYYFVGVHVVVECCFRFLVRCWLVTFNVRRLPMMMEGAGVGCLVG